MAPPADQAAVVGAVHPEVSAHLVADLPEALIVDETGIGGGTHTDQLGLVLQGQAVDLVHVDHLGLTADAIVNGVEHGAAEVELGAVAQVAAVVQGQAHKGVAGLEEGPGSTATLAMVALPHWMLAWSTPKASFTRSTASSSAWSAS